MSDFIDILEGQKKEARIAELELANRCLETSLEAMTKSAEDNGNAAMQAHAEHDEDNLAGLEHALVRANQRYTRAEAELAALRAQHHYPHMCRDGHPEIGHSTDNERCPVCLMRDERDARYPS